ncbi:DNA glycosylase [Anaerofustis sp.]|uniref:DNA-3-methyladenine glycosylase family protein n=1 Tax=Anaerofustis sp. TaxID=1872517 RepID=UPI0025C62B31|nr:DNA glycosylase [Anaerofustis sp.]
MKIERINNDLILSDMDHFNLKKTFECGQCFRWDEVGKDEFIGVVDGKVIHIKEEDGVFTFYDTDKEYFDSFLMEYFDFSLDYNEIDKKISTDDHIKKCIEYGKGIRILKQDLFETIISFIISANNNIPRIKKIIGAICEKYGNEIDYKGNKYYSFPTYEDLKDVTKEEFHELKMGFRDKYLVDAIHKINSGEIDLDKLTNMPTLEAKKELMKIKGVGEKVSDCILLFSLKRLELCPMDVWVKRIFENRYGLSDLTFENGFNLAKSNWGEYAGIAQQYLFYYERETAGDK